jgi:ATP-dependent exoDNAse (exonuclease V) beta subunit
VLSHNYRSTAPIVAAAERVIAIADPASRIAKHLVAERGTGSDVELWTADDERSECMGIASECRRLLDEGVRAADIAWLFRRHADMTAAIAALRETGVPYQVHGGRGFFTQPEIKDILAMLSAVEDPHDTQALLRCLQMPAWRVSNRGRLALVGFCNDHDDTLVALLHADAIGDLDEPDRAAVEQCLADVEELHGHSAREDVRELFQEALERSSFLGLLDQRSELARMQMGANLNKFGELLESFADWSNDRRLRTALHYLEVLRNSRHADELAAIDDVDDGVVMLTAHSAKGLEWPVVVVSGCVDTRWPGRGRSSSSGLSLPGELVPEVPPAGDATIDEERRLFYVAITRARDRLVLSRASRYPRSFKSEKRSPFVDAVAGAEDVRERDVPRSATMQPRAPRAAGRPSGERLSVGVSDIRVFKQCARRFAYRKRYHMPVRDIVNNWYGTLMHTVLQNAGMRRVAGEVVDAAAVGGLWQQAWDASRGPKGRHAELRALGEEQLRAYISSQAWTEASIAAVEESFALPLDHADVSGRWDRLDNQGGHVTVVDYKTGLPRDEEAARRDLQVRAYAVAASRREGSDSVAVELHHLQTAEVTRVVFTREQLDTAYRHLSASARDLAAAWWAGEFPPSPSAWACPRCEYRTVCDEGRAAADS